MEERKLEMKHIWAPRLDFFLAVGQKSEKAGFFFLRFHSFHIWNMSPVRGLPLGKPLAAAAGVQLACCSSKEAIDGHTHDLSSKVKAPGMG